LIKEKWEVVTNHVLQDIYFQWKLSCGFISHLFKRDRERKY